MGKTPGPGEAIIVYALKDKQLGFDAIVCADLNLSQGLNLAGFACPESGARAFQLLGEMSRENVSCIQHYNQARGDFDSACLFEQSPPAGSDFPIETGEGYLIHMKRDVSGFDGL